MHFTIKELTYSSTAVAKGISNVPTAKELTNLLFVITQLELIRSILNKPMVISSGYRSPALNKAVGGASNSAHVDGLAVDFTCPGYGDTKAVVAAIAASNIPFDQLILEYPNRPGSWVHIGFAEKGQKARRQVLVTTDGSYRPYQP